MGIRFRKSIDLGMGFRINMSKTGPGFSWGGKGFRLTRTASGNIRGTAYLPGTGLSYQKEFKNPLAKGSRQGARKEKNEHRQMEAYENEKSYALDFKNIKSTGLSEIIDAARDERPYKLLGLILVVAAIFLFFINPFLIGLSAIGLILYFYKKEGSEVDIDYDFNENSKEEFALTNKLLSGILESDEVFLIEALAEDGNRLVISKRSPLKITKNLPGKFKTNVEVTSLWSGNFSLSFLPDALLLAETNSYKAISYEDMEVDLRAEEFVEFGHVAKDANLIEKTYLHATKDGQPDRRYKDNPEISLVEYGILEMKNADFDILLGFSDTIIDGK